ncbi:hypothetical protein ACMAY6_01060 [Luminiphilus sp. nBUS_16]|uniref:hypothetical protein n=1 Tax=Luminiphilus sp. nBUS_16 TaxID=3395315 RepID=UPI003EC092A6
MILLSKNYCRASPQFEQKFHCRSFWITRFSRSALLPLAILLSLSSFTAADDQLVEITTRLIPAEGAVPGQRIKLEVAVATPRWFTAGTRIKLPEVPNLLLLQNQDFAANSTERRGSESWTVQRWFIDVFSTKPGTVVIPPLKVSVSISKATNEAIARTLETQALTITTSIPPALEGLEHWVASPSVTLVQSIDGSLDTYLGAAISRRLTIKANDVMAMLLPRATHHNEPLLQMYPEPPVLRNRSNRGTLSATRIDRTSWIASVPGTVEIPGAVVNWWDTESQTLQILRSEPLKISISGELPPESAATAETVKAVLSAAAILLAGFFTWRLIVSEWFGALGKRLGLLRQPWQRLWAVLKGSPLPNRLNPWRTR